MDWRPDRNAKLPLYKQLALHMENGIADGTFPPDKPLPSERGLAQELGVNRSTVVAAYDELESKRILLKYWSLQGHSRLCILSFNAYTSNL